jgi:hypothetical protein
MILRVAPVDPNHIQQIWSRVEHYIKDALQKGMPEGSGNYNEHHVQQFLISGQWLLLVAVDENNEVHGAATVSFINYPLHRIGFVTTIGGKLISNKETFEQLKAILIQRGATKIQGACRESVVRLWHRYGFEPCTTIVEFKL